MALVCDFQSCCTASILYGFGQEAAADGEARREGNGKTYEQTRNSIIQRVKQKQGERDGLITAITTNNQVNAIKALTELGFKNSGEVEKLRHPENTICLWWLPLKDWVEPKVEVAAPLVKNVFAQQAVVEPPPVRPTGAERFYVVDVWGNKKALINGLFRKPIGGIRPRAMTVAELIQETGHTFAWHSARRDSAGWGPLNKQFI